MPTTEQYLWKLHREKRTNEHPAYWEAQCSRIKGSITDFSLERIKDAVEIRTRSDLDTYDHYGNLNLEIIYAFDEDQFKFMDDALERAKAMMAYFFTSIFLLVILLINVFL